MSNETPSRTLLHDVVPKYCMLMAHELDGPNSGQLHVLYHTLYLIHVASQYSFYQTEVMNLEFDVYGKYISENCLFFYIADVLLV